MEKATKKNYKKLAKQRKMWLYVESVIYIIGLLLAVYLSAYGSIFFKMFPILFAIGIIGKIYFDRPVITTLIGMIFNTILLCIYNKNIGAIAVIQNTIYVGINLMSGEIIGELVLLIKEHKKKLSKVSKRAIYIIPTLIILISLLSFGMQSYVNGNYVSYVIANSKINNYIKERYNIKTKRYKDIYTVGGTGQYEFYKIINKKVYKFSIRDNSYIEDEYMEELTKNYNIACNKTINSIIDKSLLNIASSSLEVSSNYSFIKSSKNPELTLDFVYSNNNLTKEEIETDLVARIYVITELLKKNFVDNSIKRINLCIRLKDFNKKVSYSNGLIYGNNFNEEYISNSFIEEIIGLD